MILFKWLKNLKLTSKINIINCFAIILTFSLCGYFILSNIYKASIKEAKETARLEASMAAINIERKVEILKTQLMVIKETLIYSKEKKTLTRESTIELLKNILEINPDIISYYTIWEPNKFDGKDKNYINAKFHDKTGRFLPYISNINGKIFVEPIVNYDVEKISDWYFVPKKTKNITLTEPYYYHIAGKDVLITSLSIPILDEKNNYIGLIGGDFKIDYLQEVIKTLKPLEGYSLLISDNGTYLAHGLRPELIMKNINEININWINKLSKKHKKNSFAFYDTSISLNKKVLRIFTPINLSDSESQWYLIVNIPEEKILSNYNFYFKLIIITLLISIIVIIFVNIYLVSNIISKRLNKIVEILNKLAGGNFNFKIDETKEKDEIGELQNTAIKLKNDLLQLIAKLELKDSELIFSKTILENTIEEFNAAIVIASAPKGEIFTANTMALNIAEEPKNYLTNIPFELHQKHWKIFNLDGKPIDYYDLPLTKSILHGESIKNKELIMRNSRGENQNILINSNPIYDKRGKIIAGITVFMKKSETSDTKSELKEITNKLSHKIDGLMKPSEEFEITKLQDLIRIEKLQHIQDTFAEAFNVASIITNIDGTPITKPSNFCKVCDIVRSTEKGRKNCFRSDKIIGEKAYKSMKPCYEKCHSCGFIDAGAPIVVGGKYIGIWMIGQVDTAGSEERIRKYAEEIGADVDLMLNAYSQMPERVPISKFVRVVNFLWVMANEISLMGYNNLLLANDLDRTKALEKELENERKNLEKTVKERTRELQKSLIHIERANQHKNHFLSTMSHELRTPLNAIMGFTDLLNKKYYGNLNDKQLEYTRLIKDSSQHLLDLINDILNITKIDSGSIEITKEEVNIKEFIGDITAIMLPQFLEKMIKFNYYINENISTTYIDKRKTKQILLNLLSNALKFTPEKGKVDLSVKFEDQDKIIFSITDTGIGIAEKELDNIFKEFYQIDKNSLQASAGTGIGLALAKRLVEILGGQIGLTSIPDKGSTFWFTLPINN